MPTSRVVTYEDVEKVLNKVGVRTRTFFFKKSRKLSSVLGDLANKWYKLSEEDKYIINAYFMGNIYTNAMSKCDSKCDCDNCNHCDHE